MSVLSRETVLKWMLGTLTSTYRFISKHTYTLHIEFKAECSI